MALGAAAKTMEPEPQVDVADGNGDQSAVSISRAFERLQDRIARLENQTNTEGMSFRQLEQKIYSETEKVLNNLVTEFDRIKAGTPYERNTHKTILKTGEIGDLLFLF